ncbi:MAG: transposase [Chitinophagaceae bacterium]|nr:transposase [Chitinophagaceae bacterium]
MAGPALLAALVIAKFMDHIPLYRQSQNVRGGRVLTYRIPP